MSEATEPRPSLVLVTGLSGSGKSTVAKCLEDLGFYCVDNLPLPLLRQFLQDPLGLVGGKEKIAVVTDVRAPGFAQEFPGLFAEIDRQAIRPTLLYLEAAEEILVRRFSETRRPHPLAAKQNLLQGIHKEREVMAEVRGIADLVLETSHWSIHEMRERIYLEFASSPEGEPDLVVSLVSFGFKHGIPAGTDLLFDARFIDNPYFEPGLRELSGRDLEVRRFLENLPDFRELADRISDFLMFVLPRFKRENRSYVSVAVGCTGGHHRSVAIAEELLVRLNQADWSVRLLHRDIQR